MRLLVNMIGLVSWLMLLPFAQAANTAQMLFDKYQNSVLQVVVIDVESGEKSSIGSGFLVQQGDVVVSNYHVVASIIEEPDRYRLEYVTEQGDTGQLTLLDIDIINDLAILQHGKSIQHEHAFVLAQQRISKGADIFSIGNPHDLGMSIITGTYNGQPEHALYQRILFSGSLNPGMSGGPALNHLGEVIGVNVSTGGSGIGFLVPASYLVALLQRVEQANQQAINFAERIESQLFKHQQMYIGDLLAQPWQSKSLTQQLETPERIAKFIQCWGKSATGDDEDYNSVERTCAGQKSIYLGGDLRTGHLEYHIHLFKNRQLSTLRFYNMYERSFSNHYSGFSAAAEDQLSERSCNSDLVQLGEHVWKVNFCSRRYLQYPSLYDVAVNMAATGQADQGVIANLRISGCGQEEGLQLAKKFMESITWKP
ncbi:MAG: serine protease [Mariprofundaceae bacterium]|nr:serine protease [Mariprofundaceae bacterium]